MEGKTLLWATAIVTVMLVIALVIALLHDETVPTASRAGLAADASPSLEDAALGLYPTERATHPTPPTDPSSPPAGDAAAPSAGVEAVPTEPAAPSDPERAPSDAAPAEPADAQPDAGVAGGAPDAGEAAPARVSIDKETVRSVIGQMKPGLKACYDKTLESFPEAAGDIVLSFEIVAADGTGHVDLEAVAPDSSLHEQELHQCMLDELRTLEFPAPAGAGSVKVTYPFRFATADPAPDAGR